MFFFQSFFYIPSNSKLNINSYENITLILDSNNLTENSIKNHLYAQCNPPQYPSALYFQETNSML